MNFLKSKLAIVAAIVAIVGYNNVQASSYYQQAKDKAAHAYTKTKDKSNELYDKATGRAVDGPRVYMENGKKKTSLITTDKAKQHYATKKTMPASSYNQNPMYEQQVVEEQIGGMYEPEIMYEQQVVEEQ